MYKKFWLTRKMMCFPYFTFTLIIPDAPTPNKKKKENCDCILNPQVTDLSNIHVSTFIWISKQWGLSLMSFQLLITQYQYHIHTRHIPLEWPYKKYPTGAAIFKRLSTGMEHPKASHPNGKDHIPLGCPYSNLLYPCTVMAISKGSISQQDGSYPTGMTISKRLIPLGW